ncbi:MAG: rod shape-determining protein MreC [Dehalococcoidia bacterium]
MRLLWWTLAVMSMSLLSIALSQNRTLDPLQNTSLTVAAPVENGLREIADSVSDFVKGAFNRDLERENQRLREELELLQTKVAAGEDAQRRAQELEEALGVKEGRTDDEFVVADIIAQDPSGLKRAVAIDRGTEDGLDEGMVVLSKGGSLVGTVSRVYEDYAWLRLITDPNSAVNVVVLSAGDVEGSRARGVATGGLRGDLTLEMLPADAQIGEGDLVTTSGLGGNFPRALLLGSAKSVEEKPQAVFRKATLEPAADLSALDTVLVITSFLPARLAGP